MDKKQVEEQIRIWVDEYKQFMGIDRFPSFNLRFVEVSIEEADSVGFGIIANTSYETKTCKHALSVSSNLKPEKYVLFHEFTHMLDSALHVKGDKIRYMGLSGYTEYHASQIELAQMLGAKTILDIPEFSVNTIIATISGSKSVRQYICEKQRHTVELFNRADFPANIETLKSAVGILFNYWGLRSICEMYATDFEEVVANGIYLKHISLGTFSALNNLMHGWLNIENIDKSINGYIGMVAPMIQNLKLT